MRILLQGSLEEIKKEVEFLYQKLISNDKDSVPKKRKIPIVVRKKDEMTGVYYKFRKFDSVSDTAKYLGTYNSKVVRLMNTGDDFGHQDGVLKIARSESAE